MHSLCIGLSCTVFMLALLGQGPTIARCSCYISLMQWTLSLVLHMTFIPSNY